MIATPLTVDACELEHGHYSPLTKSVIRAAIDSGYPILVYGVNWILVGAGNVRFLISKE